MNLLSGSSMAVLAPFWDPATKEGSLSKHPLSAEIRRRSWRFIIGVVKVAREKQVVDAATPAVPLILLLLLRRLIRTGDLLLGLGSSCYELFVVYITEVIAAKVVRVHGGEFDG